MSQTSPVIFRMQNRVPSIRITSLYRSPPLSVDLNMQNSGFWREKITNLSGSQTSPVLLFMQYSVISTRTICLYGSQHLSVVFACKTAWFAPEWQVYMGSCPHLWILTAKQRLLVQNFTSLCVLDLTCRFVHAKHREWHQHYKSLRVPDLTCHFVHAKQRA